MTSHSTTFLRRSLQLDGTSSGLCGVLLLVAARPVADLIGLPSAGVTRAIGAFLVVFAAALLWNARRVTPDRQQALTTVALNVAWIVASAAVIVIGSLTAIGNVAVALIALAVVGFTMLEIVGLRRMRTA
jgi:hypothetical protein